MFNYAISVLGMEEVQWGTRLPGAPCEAVGQHYDSFINGSLNGSKYIFIYRQLCASTVAEDPGSYGITRVHLGDLATVTPAGWGVWGPASLEASYPAIPRANAPAFVLNELGMDPARDRSMPPGAACKHIGQSLDFALPVTYDYRNFVEHRKQTCNPQ